MANFDVELNDEVENFTVEFGEIQRITVDDFDKLRNRPSYAGQTMTHETNIPEVPTAVSQLTNDADYQTGSEVESAISTAVGDEKDAREQADAGLSQDIGVVDGKVDAEADARERADTALQGAIDDEETARKNADNGLQGQIDAITSSSDVVDIVGTYAELLQYPTAGLGDKDVIKVLQDETHNDAMSYYRWNKSSSTWSYIGSEGPYYTKSETNTLLGDKQNTLTAGSNITISSNNTISATDTTYTAGNGLTLTGTEFSADTTVLQPKLTAGDGINISAQNVISADIDPADFFTASETVDGTGSEMTLNNTIQAKIKSVQMDGDTYQQTYSGKNLFPLGAGSYTNHGFTSVYNADGSITVSGTAEISYANLTSQRAVNYEQGKTFTLSIDKPLPCNFGAILIGSGTTREDIIITAGSTSNNITLAQTHPSATLYIYGLTVGQSYSFTVYPMIEEGSTATPFEPYTGGIPSPNPDYPQDIQVVTGEQTVRVSGKNLWGNISSYSRSTNGIDFVTNADGTITASGTATATAYSVLVGGAVDAGVYLPLQAGTYTLSEKNGNKVQVVVAQSGGAIIADTSTSEVTFTLKQTTNVAIRANIPSGTAITGTLTFYPMLETGSSPTSYEPCQSQSYTIDLGDIELCKIGDYRDKIFNNDPNEDWYDPNLEDNAWYVHKAITKAIFNGTEDWAEHNTYNGIYGFRVDASAAHSDSAILASSYRAVPITVYNSNNRTYGTISTLESTTASTYYRAFLTQPNSTINNLSSFTTWLGSHNITAYYASQTPTDTKITDATLISELEALADALGYKDKTIITVSATGTNLPAILEVSAYRNSLAGVLGVIGRVEAA